MSCFFVFPLCLPWSLLDWKFKKVLNQKTEILLWKIISNITILKQNSILVNQCTWFNSDLQKSVTPPPPVIPVSFPPKTQCVTTLGWFHSQMLQFWIWDASMFQDSFYTHHLSLDLYRCLHHCHFSMCSEELTWPEACSCWGYGKLWSSPVSHGPAQTCWHQAASGLRRWEPVSWRRDSPAPGSGRCCRIEEDRLSYCTSVNLLVSIASTCNSEQCWQKDGRWDGIYVYVIVLWAGKAACCQLRRHHI